MVKRTFVLYFHSVRKHNMKNPEDQITSVLCPGLGTAVGMMEYTKCAQQVSRNTMCSAS